MAGTSRSFYSPSRLRPQCRFYLRRSPRSPAVSTTPAQRYGRRSLRQSGFSIARRPGVMPKSQDPITRETLIAALNEDLAREYQAIISYVNHSQVLKGAAYMKIADELAIHAKEELDHALQIANHVDYLGGMPAVASKPVKTSEKAEDMLKFDLESERETIRNYRRRVKQADALNEFAIAESLRGILIEEQDHLIALATALGIDPPDAGIAD